MIMEFFWSKLDEIFGVALIIEEHSEDARTSIIIHHRIKQYFRSGRIFRRRYQGLGLVSLTILPHQDLSEVHTTVTNISSETAGITC